MVGCAESGGAARRPRPLEIVSADRAEGVEYFSAQEQARMASTLHRPGIDLVERDASTGHFGFAVTLVARDGERVRRKHADHGRSFVARELGEGPIVIHACLGE